MAQRLIAASPPRVNPWVRTVRERASTRATSPIDKPGGTTPEAAPAGLGPQPGVPPPDPTEQLPRRILGREELLIRVWWVGAHGGTGESTLEQLVPGSRAARHTWPVSPDADRAARAILVARTSYTGLTAAQRALRDWASGSVPARLDGLVLIADAPGKLPKELRALVELITSAAPGRAWKLPWQPVWRLGHLTLEQASHELKELLAHLDQRED